MPRYLFMPILTFVTSWTAAIQADPVIYDNGVVPGGVVFASTYWLNGGQIYAYQSADDFILPAGSDWQVTDVHWSGRDSTDQQQVSEFFFIFYADDGGKPTGDGLPTSPVLTALESRSAVAVSSPLSGELLDYSADITPVVLEGGTRYWLAIIADTRDISGVDLHRWSWASDATTAAGPSGNAVIRSLFVAGGPPFWTAGLVDYPADANGFGLDFSLTGTRVPAPGAVVLAMLGLPAVGWARRRFR